MLLFTMKVRLGVITLADNSRILGPILSIPVDLLTWKENYLQKSRLSGLLEIQYSKRFFFDLTYLLRISKSDGIMGSFRFEATLTK